MRRVLAEFSVTDLGRSALLRVEPFERPEDLARSFAKAREVEHLLDDGPLVRGFEAELEQLLETFESDSAELAGRDFLFLARVISSSQAAIDRIIESKMPVLGEEVIDAPDLSELTRAIAKSFDERGLVRDDATPSLARLSRHSRRARQALYERLTGFVGRERDNLAEETISVQDGRLVLMLRAGSKGRLPGVVQGRSATGKSFYFEPLQFVEDNNELRDSQQEEAAERRRIVTELVDRVRTLRTEVRFHWRVVAELDRLQAQCAWKRQIEGEFIVPSGDGSFELVEARHPLLDPLVAAHRETALGQAGHVEAVVPLSVELAHDSRMLVVTGPNAGGKTVALKTVGLLILAAHCGFPIPVGVHSRLPFLSTLVAVVGDEQDLLEERSTFSGRLLRLREAWEAARPDSLLLVDELGSGTDPAEGSALGIALLEGLATKGPWTVITTHLTAIAATALELENASCAAMEFDADTGRPTYRLVRGAPGASEALALGRRLGLPEVWIDRAEELLGPEERRLRRLLQEVEALREGLRRERSEARQERAAAARDRAEAAEWNERAQDEHARVAKRLKREFRDFRDQVRGELNQELERVALEVRAGRKTKAASDAAKRLFRAAPDWKDTETESTDGLEAGDLVEHESLGWRGRLQQIDGDKASVAVHGKRVTCRLTELVAAKEAAGEAVGMAREPSALGAPEKLSESVVELMLVGQRVEPALEELERFLDQALLGSHDRVRIVHGHGTGRLRSAIRTRLEQHPVISEWRSGGDSEGRDGATIATLA